MRRSVSGKSRAKDAPEAIERACEAMEEYERETEELKLFLDTVVPKGEDEDFE